MSTRVEVGIGGDGAGGSRADLAYRRLKAAIESGALVPGHRMREAELAEWLGISRTPVRDALRQLESDGLLVAAPRRGLLVAELDQQQVTEIYALRAVLEGLAARLAAQQASAAEVAALEDILDRQARTPDDDSETLARLNRVFHERIYRTARNRYLLDVLQALESSLTLLPRTTYAQPGRPATALAEHQVIVAAIVAHDPDTAESAARIHIRAAERIRLFMLLSPADGGPGGPETARGAT